MLSNFELHLFVLLGVLGKLQQFQILIVQLGLPMEPKFLVKRRFYFCLSFLLAYVSQYFLSKK